MSGHSKWSKIKHKKGLNDAKKGKIYSKYAQQITIAARDGGGDLSSNFSLRLLVDKAKSESMPGENIKRAIDRGTGKSGEALVLDNVLYEGFGPDGIAILVETLTDNKNRTVAELRQIFSGNGGSLGESGSVSWNFDQKGLVLVRPAKIQKSEKFGKEDTTEAVDKEDAMMEFMEIEGILDIEDSSDQNIHGEEYDVFEVYTDSKKLTQVRDEIIALGFVVESAALVWMPRNYKEIAGLEEKLENFIEAIEELEEVQNVYTDAKA